MSKREMTDSLERPGLLKDVKVVLVGTAKCGKTALIQRFVNDTFSDNYVPTGFEKYSTKTKLGDYTVEYSIWDTSGSGSYDTVRPLAYQDAQVFILCFSVVDPDSLELTIGKWLPEVRSHCPSTPIILCGCKADVRLNAEDTLYMNQAAISRDQAALACQHIGAVAYVETCSRFSNPAVPEVFEIAAEAALGISATSLQTTKAAPKKRKMYSVTPAPVCKSNSAPAAKPHIKSEIRKSAKNCSVM